ncbi:MAG: hypothetical protein OHK0015_55940 [Chloroflexi bacterium OHK40]
MKWRSIGMQAALALGLAIAIGAGALAGISRVSAQTTPQAQSAPLNTLWELFLDRLAATLGIERAALDTAMATAGAEAAAEAVQDGTLTQEQADALTARLQAGDYGALFGRRGGPGGPGNGHELATVHMAALDAAAAELGLTSEELRAQLHSGSTVAELAEANGTTEQAVITAALAAAKAELDELVAAGTLTQEQADAIYERMEQAGSNLFIRGGPRGGFHGGPGTPPAAPTAPTDTSDA